MKMGHIGLKGAAFLIAGALLVSGCDKARSLAGMEKQSPDEFAVVTRAPLSVPPDFGLRPPAPGATRPQEKSVRSQARDVLLRDSGANTGAAAQGAVPQRKLSNGEAALLARAGALNADGSIRKIVDRENTALVETASSVFDKVFFWQDVDPPGTIVDPGKESRGKRKSESHE